MLVFIVDSLVVRNVDDDWVFDVLELFGTNVDDGLVISAFHVHLQADQVFIELQVAVLKVDLVAALVEEKRGIHLLPSKFYLPMRKLN